MIYTTNETKSTGAKKDVDKDRVKKILNGYVQEGKEARATGENPRDKKWEENLDLYWNRYDFSDKADWQATETLAEVPNFVDRFAAALKEALVAAPEGFYTVIDPSDTENDIAGAIKRCTDVWLSRSGRNQNGHLTGFPAVFEEQVKQGALMSMCSSVVWRDDVEGGRVAIESVDPRNVWFDPTYRGLYRIREIEIDKHNLDALSSRKGGFDKEMIEDLKADIDEKAYEKEQLTGHGAGHATTTREPVKLHEILATVVDSNGERLANRALSVLANDEHLILGPKKNPFWHDKDWLVYTPLVSVPMSIYGRSYMEDFGAISKAFTELTNLILDAVLVSTINVTAIIPEALRNPEESRSIHPGKVFELNSDMGIMPKDFMASMNLGGVSRDSVEVWQSLKNELREAAGLNEVGLGQFAPNSRTSATEIVETAQSSSAIIRSVAQTIEHNYLDSTLDLTWKTGLQYAKADDPMLAAAAGPQMWQALISQRKELIQRPITFQARGISTLIARGQTLRNLMQILQVAASNEMLMQAFMQKADMGRLIDLIFQLSNVDISKIQASERDRLARSISEPLQQQAGSGRPLGSQSNAAANATRALGVGG